MGWRGPQLRRPLLVPLLQLLLLLLLLLAKRRPKRAWMPPRLAALPAEGEGRFRDISGRGVALSELGRLTKRGAGWAGVAGWEGVAGCGCREALWPLLGQRLLAAGLVLLLLPDVADVHPLVLSDRSQEAQCLDPLPLSPAMSG